jgi:hypothetical protein
MESYFAWLILPIQPFFNQLSGMLNSLNLVPFYSDPDYLTPIIRGLRHQALRLCGDEQPLACGATSASRHG